MLTSDRIKKLILKRFLHKKHTCVLNRMFTSINEGNNTGRTWNSFNVDGMYYTVVA